MRHVGEKRKLETLIVQVGSWGTPLNIGRISEQTEPKSCAQTYTFWIRFERTEFHVVDSQTPNFSNLIM